MGAKTPKIVFVAMVAYAAIHFSSYYQALPAVVASHFGARGVANGWQSKDTFFKVLIGVSALAGVLVFAVPALVTSLPVQFVNLPNKEYWLSPERVAESKGFMTKWFGWFGCAVYAVVCYAFDYAVKSNLEGPQPSSPAGLWWVFGGFLTFTVFASIQFRRRFGKVPDTDRVQPL